MMLLSLVRWLLLVAEIVIALPILYLVVLSLSAIVASQRRKARLAKDIAGVAPHLRFAILIPAHNEETILSNLLTSLAQLNYPKDLYTVNVVADNCSDGTADLVRRTGWVRVYERFDTAKRGKGYALNWLLARLEEEATKQDAYIVLDADSVVEPAFLSALSRELEQGAQALQANNTVLNITEAPSAALRLVALTLINHLRPLGRNGIGSTSTLTGNGMCLRRELLQRHPWQAFSIGEDYQYYLTLVEHGERVQYVPEAVVRSQMPVTFMQMRTQDVRWESAESQTTWNIALRLWRSALSQRDWRRLEAMLELLTPPLSLLVGWSCLALIAALGMGSLPEKVLSGLLCGGLLGYIGTALYLLRPPREVYLALLHAPGFVLWKLWVYFVLRRSKRHTSEWVRTSRTTS